MELIVGKGIFLVPIPRKLERSLDGIGSLAIESVIVWPALSCEEIPGGNGLSSSAEQGNCRNDNSREVHDEDRIPSHKFCSTK